MPDQHILGSLYITTPDSYLSVDHDAIKIAIDGEASRVIPLLGIDGVVVIAPRAVSAGVVGRLAETGRPLTLLDRRGVFAARIVGPVSGNVHLRVAQYATTSAPAALEVARSIVLAKIQNSRRLLSRRSRDATGELRGTIDVVVDALRERIARTAAAGDIDVIRGCEGDAAHLYFSVFGSLVAAGGRAFFLERRERRPPRGRMNALLSYLYTLLVHDATAAAEAIGLDPQVGFLHALRPGRPSLALDLMEELRAPLADRLALRLVNRKELTADGFTVDRGGAVYLNDEGRRTVTRAWAQRRQDLVRHSLLREEVPWGLVLHVQARLLARYLRGELSNYPAFLAPS